MLTKPSAMFVYLTLGVGLSLYAALCLSTSSGSWPQLSSLLMLASAPAASLDHLIFWDIRLPRALLAALSGAALGMAGALSQGIFRNPLASPSLVGTQSGGVLFAVIGFHLLTLMDWTAIAILTITGCFTTHLIIAAMLLCLSRRHQLRSDDLVMVGFAIHIFLSGLTTLILATAITDTDKTLAIFKWLFGSYALATWTDVTMLTLATIMGLSLALVIAYRLDVFSLSQHEATSLAVRTHRLTQQAMLGVSILVGGSVASCGGIPFIGLMAPHIARLSVGGAHRRLIPAAALIGTILTTSCDTLARTIIYPRELETGVLLITLGAPFFIFILWQQRTRSRP